MTPEEMMKSHFETLNRDFAEFKKANDERVKAIETKGYAPAELEQKVAKISEGISKVEAAIDALKTAQNRPAAGTELDTKSALKLAKSAMNAWMKKGKMTQEQAEALATSFGEEYKALSTQSDGDGGYFVRPEVMDQAFDKAYESSPMRKLASIQTISTDSLELNGTYGEPESEWVGEMQDRTETDPAALKQVLIAVHELSASPKATQKLIDDASVDIEAWHAAQVVEAFARKEATAFISGNGVAKPKGILAYEAGDGFNKLEQVVSGHATSIDSGDALISLQGALFEQFQGNAAFMMARATLTAVRKLKDGQGQYLWAPGLNAGEQASLLGKPVYYAADMQALGAGNLVAAYGDFKAGYQIVDRIGIRVLRDPFTSKGKVVFYTVKRVGGGVKQFQAIKLLKCSVS